MKRVAISQPEHVKNGLSSLSSTMSFPSELFKCLACQSLLEDPYMSKCGHTCCYMCWFKISKGTKKCVHCNAIIELDEIYPNHSIDLLIKEQKKVLSDKYMTSKRAKFDENSKEWKDVEQKALLEGLQVHEIDEFIKSLEEKRKNIIKNSNLNSNKLLLDFLVESNNQNKLKIKKINLEQEFLSADIQYLREAIASQDNEWSSLSVVPSNNTDSNNQLVPKPSTSLSWLSPDSKFAKSMAKRKARLHSNFNLIKDCYVGDRVHYYVSPESTIEKLGSFSSKFNNFMKYNKIKDLAHIDYVNGNNNHSNIVSSIDFDKTGTHFAVAGVTKKIKLYDYDNVTLSPSSGHCPVVQMTCDSKISCIRWSPYHQNWLCSCDYQGNVLIWDAFRHEKLHTFIEHEKRCWSVDFNSVDPKLVASGSDDAKVKIWSTNSQRSITTIEARANVCCVQFNPKSSMHVAFGGADHDLHYYDLRNPKQPLNVFKGHKKAVSYCKFVDKHHFVSASTDSHLKMWQVDGHQAVRTFKGHTNDKNFVGMDATGEFIACGSEDNHLYVYHKHFDDKLFSHRFAVNKSLFEKEEGSAYHMDGPQPPTRSKEFVSAVTFRKLGDDCDVIVAANSQGTIKVLKLV